VSAVARRQVEAADFLVISKRELIRARALARLRAKLSSLNPRALVLEGEGGAEFEGGDLLLATSAAALRERARAESGTEAPDRPAPAPDSRSPGDVGLAAPFPNGGARDHLAGDGIETFSWASARRFERAAFEKALGALPSEVLRAKGLLARADGEGAWLFQVVCGRVELTAFEGAVPGSFATAQGVFIGPGIAKLRDRIVAGLDSASASGSG
jgi:G3E family GTPase